MSQKVNRSMFKQLELMFNIIGRLCLVLFALLGFMQAILNIEGIINKIIIGFSLVITSEGIYNLLSSKITGYENE